MNIVEYFNNHPVDYFNLFDSETYSYYLLTNGEISLWAYNTQTMRYEAHNA